jgi:hypothetical protein
VKTFSDGEIQIEIDENVRMKDVFIVQSTCQPVNENLVELLLLIDAFKRSSAKRITAVIPVLRVCPPGPESCPAGPHQRQTGRRHAGSGRCQPGHHDGFACRTDPGVFRYPGGQPVCRTGHSRVYPGAFSPESGGGFPGRGRGRAGTGLCQAVGRRSGHYRQTPRKAQRCQSHGGHRGRGG